ncbi:MAG: heavy-metal-associated domain-containing protein [Verrucomicrobia bacterium]|nr:heavy-metal-associated domain-containing protein [Verrucomicrobiota bacterium]
MTCEMCTAGVKKSLTKLDGVKTADVSLDKGQAIVTFDPAKVTTGKLIAAIGKAGGSQHTFKAEEATEPAKKSQQIFCEGLSAGQLCGHGTVDALKLSGDKKVAWSDATKRYNMAVEAATKQLLKEAKETLSPEESAVVEKWFAKGVNAQINQQLAKETTK